MGGEVWGVGGWGVRVGNGGEGGGVGAGRGKVTAARGQ